MKILLAVDASSFSQGALNAVLKDFRPGVAVRVMNVIEPITAYLSAELMPHLVSTNPALELERKKQADQLVRHMAERLRKAGFRASELVASGDPKSAILAEASDWNASLIVLGSHGLKGMDRLLMGSVSDAVVRHATCSVEVVRTRVSKKTRR